MRNRHYFLIIGLTAILCGVLPTKLLAATVFVDNTLGADITNGRYSIANRDASGSDGNAYRTVKAAVSAMVAGDTCYIRGGTYYETGINLAPKDDGTELRPYTLASYQNEWATIDGNHAGVGDNQSIFVSYEHPVSYWRLSRLEITGGGNLSTLPKMGAGISVLAKHCLFQYLYIHDNYARVSSWGAAGGMMLLAGSQSNVVEFCRFKGNGNPTGELATSNANLAIFADYRYFATVREDIDVNPIPIAYSVAGTPGHVVTSVPHGLHTYDFLHIGGHSGSSPNLSGDYTVQVISPTELALTTVTGTQTLGTPITITTAGTGGVISFGAITCRNEVRYNLFEGVSAAGMTPVGIVHKGFQRLAGNAHGEAGDAADALPNDGRYRSYGDNIHHNVFLGHAQAARLDQDYVQFHNNIVDIDLTGAISATDFRTATDRFAAVRTSDAFITRRGSFWPAVYNNTILANGGQALTLTVIKGGWDCSVDGTVSDYSAGFAPNNIIDSADNGYDWMALTVNTASSANCAGSQPHVLTKFNLSRNLVYNAKDPTTIIHFERAAGDYTTATIARSGAADVVWSKTDASPYVGTTGSAKYKVGGGYSLDASHTIGNGGLGGKHPYLDVQIPTYIGAVDPADPGWVDIVLGLSVAENLKNGESRAPARPSGVVIKKQP